MLEDALRYPLESDDRVSTLLIGGVLVVLSVLILPAFVVQGYLVRVLRSAATGETEAPSFTDWGSLFVDGAKLFVVNLVYGLVVIVPMAVLGLVAGFGFAGVANGNGGSAGVAALGTVTLLLVGLVVLLSLLLAYVLPAAITNFAVQDRLGAAFDFGTIRQVVFTSDYFVGVLLGLVLTTVIGGVASAFSLVLIGIPFLFYAQVVGYYCFGRGFAEGRASMAPGMERVP